MQSVIVEIVRSLATIEFAKKAAKIFAIGFASALGAIAARKVAEDQPRRFPTRRP